MNKIKEMKMLYKSDEDISYEDSFDTSPLKEGEKISIVSDSMFKTVFFNSTRKEYSAKLISLVMEEDYDKVYNNLRLIKNELDKDKNISKNERADFVATLGDTICNIEMNNNINVDTLYRNQDYSHRLFSSNIRVGSKYRYNPVIQININNFSFKGNDKIIDYFYVMNEEKVLMNNKLIYINIYLPNIKKKCYNEGVESLNELERYLMVLAEKSMSVAKEISKGDVFLKNTEENLEEFCLTPDLLRSYDKEEMMVEGGKRQGREKTKKEDAINLHKNGVSNEIIIKSLNITQEKLEEYLKEAE